MTTHSARPYQAKMIRDIERSWASGNENALACLPTGAGKTFIFASMIAQERGASVAIAHRRELVSQMSLALAREGVRHRIIGPPSLARSCVTVHMDALGQSFYDPNSQYAAASVNTLLNVSKNDPWLKQVRLWVQDECHHVLEENQWGKACALFPNARGLGVTATPIRADGKGLGRHADGLFDDMILGPSMRDLISAGYLTDYRVVAPPSQFNVSSIPLSASGDFSPTALRAERRVSKVTGDVVSHYLKFAAGKLGVTFEVDVESATETAAAFRVAGVPAEVVSAKTPDFLRAQILRRFKNREVLQLVNVDLFGEGFDLPAIEVVSMARPTQSYALYCQQFGRALRPLPGKTHALIIDHVGNVLRHRLPDAKREWSLDRREKRSSAGPGDAIPIRVCANPECNAPYERVLPACPFCGVAPEPAQRGSPEFVDGDLQELDPEALAALRGEIERIDGPVKIPYGLGGIAARGAVNQWRARQDAQTALREKMALWGGWQAAQERPTPEAQKRFFFRFGHDVATAMTLGAREAEELRVLICDDLDENGVTEA